MLELIRMDDPTRRTETNRNICYQVLLQKREFTPRGTHKQVILFLTLEMFR